MRKLYKDKIATVTEMKKELFVYILLSLIIASLVSIFVLVQPEDSPDKNLEKSFSSPTGHATVSTSVSLSNPDPNITSVTLFELYSDIDSHSNPTNNFTICNSAGNKTIHLQFNYTDPNGFGDVQNSGAVSYTIVFFNETTSEQFIGFGPSLLNATFEIGAGSTGTFHAEYNMTINDTKTSANQVYIIKPQVIDLETNANSSINVNFTFQNLTCDIYVNESVELQVNISEALNATNETGVELNITLNASVNGSISVENSTTFDPDDSSFKFKQLNKFLTIKVSEKINKSISEVIIRVDYTDDDLTAVDATEAELKLYKWSGNNWTVLPNNTVNATHNFLTATTNNFSQFGVFAQEVAVIADDDDDSSSSATTGGGGGGGGGGRTQEVTGEAVADTADAPAKPTPAAPAEPAQPAPDDTIAAEEETAGLITDIPDAISDALDKVPAPVKKTFNYTVTLALTLIALAVIISNVAVYTRRYEIGYAIRSNRFYQALKLDVFSHKSRAFDKFRLRLKQEQIKNMNHRKKLKAKINEWKKKGIDTAAMKNKLQSMRKSNVVPHTIKLEKTLDKWKKKGYDTRSLESSIKVAAKSKKSKKSTDSHRSFKSHVKEIKSHIINWKKKGYDTKVLEHNLKNAKLHDKEIKSIRIKNIKSQIKEWKKLGYDTTPLENNLNNLKKKK